MYRKSLTSVVLAAAIFAGSQAKASVLTLSNTDLTPINSSTSINQTGHGPVTPNAHNFMFDVTGFTGGTVDDSLSLSISSTASFTYSITGTGLMSPITSTPSAIPGGFAVTNMFDLGDGSYVLHLTTLASASTVGGSLSVSAVPEVSTWAMMLLGFAGLGFAGYRQTKKQESSFAAA